MTREANENKQHPQEKLPLNHPPEAAKAAGQQEITRALFAALEKERLAIKNELEENICQTLAITNMFISMAKTNKKSGEAYLDKSGELIKGVIESLRTLTQRLVIPDAPFTGLFDCIENLIAGILRENNLAIRISGSRSIEHTMEQPMQLNIYRIIQYQLDNVLLHAAATSVDIELSRKKNNIVLRFTDNGCGCKINEVKRGVGTLNILCRTFLYNGTVSVKSSPGNGYALTVLFPLLQVNNSTAQ